MSKYQRTTTKSTDFLVFIRSPQITVRILSKFIAQTFLTRRPVERSRLFIISAQYMSHCCARASFNMKVKLTYAGETDWYSVLFRIILLYHRCYLYIISLGQLVRHPRKWSVELYS